ncbi:MAG: hypothetical protein A2163_02220 [Actinobacteria bacterium RBG_13_35_12]|nr:MAG: hypothetical protein A2163_02220 [Actinobacteria bacterium RBG_13_35_12]
MQKHIILKTMAEKPLSIMNGVMKMIYNQNYEGCISVEYEGDDDEFEGITSSVRLIKRYL